MWKLSHFLPPPPIFSHNLGPTVRAGRDRRGLENIMLPSAPRAIVRHLVRVSALKICPSPAGIPNVQRWSNDNPAPALELLLFLKSCNIQWFLSLVFSGFMKLKADPFFSLTSAIFSQGFFKFIYLLSLLPLDLFQINSPWSLFCRGRHECLQSLKSKLQIKLARPGDISPPHRLCWGQSWLFHPVFLMIERICKVIVVPVLTTSTTGSVTHKIKYSLCTSYTWLSYTLWFFPVHFLERFLEFFTLTLHSPG